MRRISGRRLLDTDSIPVGAAAAVGVMLLSSGATAYALTEHSDGTLTVTISELRDASGLQQALRDDGVNAYVSYNGSQPLPVPTNGGFPAVVHGQLATGSPAGAPHSGFDSSRSDTSGVTGDQGSACHAPIADLVTLSDGDVTFTIPANLLGSQATLDISTTGSGSSVSDLQVEWYC